MCIVLARMGKMRKKEDVTSCAHPLSFYCLAANGQAMSLNWLCVISKPCANHRQLPRRKRRVRACIWLHISA